MIHASAAAVEEHGYTAYELAEEDCYNSLPPFTRKHSQPSSLEKIMSPGCLQFKPIPTIVAPKVQLPKDSAQ